MYDQKDFIENAQQLRRELIMLLIMSLPFIIGIIISLIFRIQLVTVVLSIIYGALFIFLYNMRLAPVTAYRRYLRNIKTGLKRETEGALVSLDSDETYKEGVRFYTMLINVDTKMDPEGERLFYYDVCKPRPDIKEGDLIYIKSHGNYVIELRPL